MFFPAKKERVGLPTSRSGGGSGSGHAYYSSTFDVELS